MFREPDGEALGIQLLALSAPPGLGLTSSGPSPGSPGPTPPSLIPRHLAKLLAHALHPPWLSCFLCSDKESSVPRSPGLGRRSAPHSTDCRHPPAMCLCLQPWPCAPGHGLPTLSPSLPQAWTNGPQGGGGLLAQDTHTHTVGSCLQEGTSGLHRKSQGRVCVG